MDNQPRAIAHRLAELTEEFHKLLRDAPWKHTNQSADPQHQTQDKSQNGPGEIAIVSPSPQDTNSAKGAQKKSFPWWRVVEGLGILAAVIVAGVNVFQWQDLRHNFSVDQRAWIKIGGNFGPEIPRTELPLVLLNAGKSPATIIGVLAALEIVNAKNAPLLQSNAKFRKTTFSILFPDTIQGAPLRLLYDPNVDGSVHTLTDLEVKELKDGTIYLAAYGFVVYADQFGTHWTRFCAWKDYANGDCGHPVCQLPFEAETCIPWNAVGEGSHPPLQ